MRVLFHVEDDDGIAAVFRAAVEEARIDATVSRVVGGEQALRYLRGAGLYSGATRPDIVFLDLNMPGVDGWRVLWEIGADESLRSIPVVVLTTSSRQSDKDHAFALGARHYITKPSSFDEWIIEVHSACRRFMPSAAAGA